MPSYGEKQERAGVKLSTPKRCMPIGERTMRSRNRSEERRVGKECRSRWSQHH